MIKQIIIQMCGRDLDPIQLENGNVLRNGQDYEG
jgi:hypothetical protein